REICAKIWTHVIFVWNRSTRIGKLYLNGAYAGEKQSAYTGQDIDLNLTNHTTYELGLKKDSMGGIRGSLRDLMVFLRPLTTREAFTLYTITGYPQFYEGLCGWKNSNQSVSPWKQAVGLDMAAFTKQVKSYLQSRGRNSERGFMKDSNYQLDFVENHNGYVNITDLPDLVAFTICFWMKTSDNTSAGTPIWYRVRYETNGKYVPAIALVDYRGFGVYIGEEKSDKTDSAANNGKWHHICLVWTSEGGKFTLHNDLSILLETKLSEGEKIPGGGEFVVGLTEDLAKEDPQAGQFIGLISHVNIFKKALDRQEIEWMSHGCGKDFSHAIYPWSQFIKGFVGDVKDEKPALCADREGYRFMVFNNNTSQPSQTSFFESPLYERSYEGHNICIRFRYLIYGPGRQFLRIYQQMNLTDYPRRLMWAVNESGNTDLIWKYGRVALPSVTKYKVSLEADLGGEPGYISVRGVHVVPGYCYPLPFRATKDFQLSFTTMSGIILSPHHPGYYPPLTRCRWTINVPRGNTIKLRFLEFQLEDHPSCFKDSLEIYSGLKSRTFLGRYCGERFPAFVESSSNVMVITFKSNDKITGLGFKLRYTSEKGEELLLHGLKLIHHPLR
ncbi:unnamed protein product, partial [Porites evermanni]